MADTTIPSEEEGAPPTLSALTDLTNAANLQYNLKHYSEAAELYSRATEMQTVLRGDEMAPENAELLYLYGRCLFKVAVSKSDVLGGQVAQEKKPAAAASKPAKAKGDGVESPGQKLAEDVVEAVVEEKDSGAGMKEKDASAPFFQLVDAEWSDDEGEDDEEAGEGEVQEALEEEDDFATAYEILDVARVLLERQVQAQQITEQESNTSKGKGKADSKEISKEMRLVKERLADTHDLQAEISLENERFDEAITDFTSAAALKDELYPRASSIVAEAHYKLSLALEFESMSAVRAAQAQEEGGVSKSKEKPEVNEELREQARKETELTVESIKARIPEEEAKLENLQGKEKEAQKREIEDVKEILKEMEDRVCFSSSSIPISSSILYANTLPNSSTSSTRQPSQCQRLRQPPQTTPCPAFWRRSSVNRRVSRRRGLKRRQRMRRT